MQRFELKRHVSRRLGLGRRTGPARNDEITIAILLHPKDDHALAEAARAVADPGAPQYGKFLSTAEVRRLVAPGYQDLDSVLAWIHDSGLTAGEPSGARTVIQATGPVEAVAKALDTPIGRFDFPSGLVPPVRGARFSIERNPSIPSPLAPIVRGIAGLNDLPAARFCPPPMAPRRSRVPRRGPGDERGPGGGYTPAAIASAYGGPPHGQSLPAGAGERVAILEFGGGFSVDDFSVFCETYGLPPGNLGEISVGGAVNDYRGRTGDADVEVALDMDWVRATAPDAWIDLCWVPNIDRGWVDFLSRLLDTPDGIRPSIVSISWGMPEDGLSTSRRYDQTRQLFLSASLLGVTFVCASGDNGAADETARDPGFDAQRHVDFPSVVPEVTSVGGTTLLPNARGFAETVWNDGAKGGATGGGFSRFIRVPDWQRPALGKRTGVTGRGVPDVAAVAAPDPGLSIRVRRTWTAAGGTSVAAPIWAGFLARVNAARVAAGKPRLGAANAMLYALAARHTPFRDIVSGNNTFAGVVGFAAGKGWDPATGLGSPDVAKLVARLTG